MSDDHLTEWGDSERNGWGEGKTSPQVIALYVENQEMFSFDIDEQSKINWIKKSGTFESNEKHNSNK